MLNNNEGWTGRHGTPSKKSDPEEGMFALTQEASQMARMECVLGLREYLGETDWSPSRLWHSENGTVACTAQTMFLVQIPSCYYFPCNCGQVTSLLFLHVLIFKWGEQQY